MCRRNTYEWYNSLGKYHSMSRKKQPADKLTAHAVILTNCTKESGGLCNFDAFVTVPEFPHSACF